MNITDDLSFDQWYEVFVQTCIDLGYTGPMDKYSFEWNFEDGETPEAAAKNFVDQMNIK